MKERNKKVLFVCSGGGHLSDLLEIRDAFEGMEQMIAIYSVNLNIAKEFFDKVYPVTFPLSLKGLIFMPFIDAIKVLLKERPDYIVSSGSEITIPFFYLGKLFGAKLIYLECCAQVNSPSITGRLVNPITDLFLVQWKLLADKYLRKAKYVGGLI